jgi:flagellin-like protein
MVPSPFFVKKRRGVSELYAAVLMIGVTLSLGSMVVAAATSQFGLASSSAYQSFLLRQNSAGVQIGLVYAAVSPGQGCPSYRGYQEGMRFTLGLYDYGTVGFQPAGFVVNATDYGGAFAQMQPGALASYTFTLSACAHRSGLTVVAYDAGGDVVQFEI